MTLLTIGGDNKLACRVRDVQVTYPDGATHWHGPFSWAFAQALLNTPARSSWIRIMVEMESLIQQHGWEQPLLFRGQPTRLFGL